MDIRDADLLVCEGGKSVGWYRYARPYSIASLQDVPVCANRMSVPRIRAVRACLLCQVLPELVLESCEQGRPFQQLHRDKFDGLEIPVPSLDEQHAIAAFLDRETERIDTLIAKKERQIEILQEKRAALISHAVTKGLNPNVKMKDSGIEWLGKIPGHWEVKRT